MFPLLPLTGVSPDVELARRLPRRLAYYHLALPIAQDEDHITVAMAYPDKAQVISVLETVLGMKVMPVRSDPGEIRAALDLIWQDAGEARALTLLAWSDTVEDQERLRDYALGIAPAFGLACDRTGIDAISLDDLLLAAQKINPALIVAAVNDPPTLESLLHRAATPVLLMRGSPKFPGKILHILRGHTPDRYALDWIIPLAHHFSASVTLLAAATSAVTDYRQGSPLISDFANLLLPNHPTRLAEFGQVLASVGLKGKLKIRQGLLDMVVMSEITAQPYDFVAIATEAYGDFVYRVLQRLPDISASFLIIKP
jgi:hypothetical protein